MRGLLDVNVLIALLDAGHAMHERAHAWWGEKNPAWASCPLTENGVVRIMTSAAYGQTRRFGISQIVTSWNTFIAETDHEFWPDSISVCDAARVRHDRILTSRHLTDIYLLALAIERGGQLVSFDQGIPITAVKGARAVHLVTL